MEKKNVEAIYPLSPMQQGLLFHSLQAGGDDPGALHVRCRLEGELEAERFAEAWSEVVRRHPALRTALRWKGLDEPLQIVLRSVDLPWTVEDLSAERPLDQQRRMRAYLAAERERGLDLGRPPTMRLALFRLGEEVWHLVWTCHHVLLDGWSSALVLREVIAVYNARAQAENPELAPAPSFQRYVQWMKRQPEAEAETFWHDYLGGVTGPTPLPFDGSAEAPDRVPGSERQQAELPAHTAAALQALARRHQLTLGTVLYGAWALLLSRYSGQTSVVFGATSSGRAVDLPGVEGMAGLLINTLPIRANVEADTTALDVFRALHAAQADQLRYAYSSPAQIQAWSEVPAHRRLFESLMVIENYPHATDADGPLTLCDLNSGITSNYPLTIIVKPGDTLELHVLYDRLRFEKAAITRLLYAFERVLEHLAEDAEQTLDQLLPADAAVPETRRAVAEGPEERSRLALDEYVAPRDALEHQLAAIWEDVLNVHPVGIHDGFFDLGGQSMQAIQLLNRIERDLGEKLPISLLLDTDDIAGMGKRLRGEEVPSWASLVPLEPGGTRPPLFCVHSYDGQVMFYRPLARHLGPDQPVYGLQAVGLDGATEPLTDVKEMAERYVEEIRSVQPEGPYALLSICFGIAVSLEMARILAAQGEEVSRLFVLDSAFDHLASERAGAPPRVQRNRMQRVLGGLRDGSLIRELPAHLAIRGRRVKEHVQRFKATRVQANMEPQQQRIWRVTEANLNAWKAYRAAPYAGEVTLVRSSAWSGWGDKRWHVPVWTELALGGLTVRTVPANHEDMLREPYVQALAALLDLSPGAAQEAGGDGVAHDVTSRERSQHS